MSLIVSFIGQNSFFGSKSISRCGPRDLSNQPKTLNLNVLGKIAIAENLIAWSQLHAKTRRNATTAATANKACSEKNINNDSVENALKKDSDSDQESHWLNHGEENKQANEDEQAYAEAWINCMEEARAERSLGPLIKCLFPNTAKNEKVDAELESALQWAVATIKDDEIAIDINGAIDIANTLANVCNNDIYEANAVLKRLTQPLDIAPQTPQLETKYAEHEHDHNQQIEEKAWRCAQQLAQAKGDGLYALLRVQRMDPDAANEAGPAREAAFIVYLQAGHKLRTIDSEISAIPDNVPRLLLFNPKANQACIAMTAARKILQWHNESKQRETKQCGGNIPSSEFDDANKLTSQERIAYRSWQWGFDENQPGSALDQAVRQLLKAPIWLKRAAQHQQEKSEYQRTSAQLKKIIKAETWKLRNVVEEHISAGGAMAKGDAEDQGTRDQLGSEIKKMDKTASLPLKNVVEACFNAGGAMAKGHVQRAFNKEKTPFRKINGSIGTDLQHIQSVQENYDAAMREVLEYFFKDLKHRMRDTENGTALAKRAFIYANLCVWRSHGFPTPFKISKNMFLPLRFHAEDFINQCKPQESNVKKEAQALFDGMRYARFKSWAPGSDFFSLATIKNDLAEKRLKADPDPESENLEALVQQAELCAVEKDSPIKEISADALQEHAKAFIAKHADGNNNGGNGNGNTYSSTDGSELGVDFSIFHHLKNLPVFKTLVGPFAGGTYNRLVSYEISSDESGSQISFGKTKGAEGAVGISAFAGFYQFSMGALTGILGISAGIGLTGKAEKVTHTLLRATHPDSNDAMVDAYWNAIKKVTKEASVSDKDISDKDITHVFLDALATACFADNNISLSCEQTQNTQLGVGASANTGAYLGGNFGAGRSSVGPFGRLKAKWTPYWTSRKTEKNGTARRLAKGRGKQFNLDAVAALGIPTPPIGEENTLRAKPRESKKLSQSLLDQGHYTHIEWIGSHALNPTPQKVLRKIEVHRKGYFDDDALSQSPWADRCGDSKLRQFLDQIKQWSDDERVLIEHWQMTDGALKKYQHHLNSQRSLTAQKSMAITRREKRKINASLNALSKKIETLTEDDSAWQPAGIEAYRKTQQDNSLDANFLFVANHKQSEEGISDRLWLPIKPEKLKKYTATTIPQPQFKALKR